jgi:hypothetical protein
MPDLNRSRIIADRQIRRWGKGCISFLVRDGVKRPCIAARAEYKPTERGLYLDGSERFYVSSLGLVVEPNHELDLLEFKPKGQAARRYRITMPSGGPRPNGLVIYHDLNCMFTATV